MKFTTVSHLLMCLALGAAAPQKLMGDLLFEKPLFEFFWWNRVVMDEFHEAEAWGSYVQGGTAAKRPRLQGEVSDGG